VHCLVHPCPHGRGEPAGADAGGHRTAADAHRARVDVIDDLDGALERFDHGGVDRRRCRRVHPLDRLDGRLCLLLAIHGDGDVAYGRGDVIQGVARQYLKWAVAGARSPAARRGSMGGGDR
jgi:hypothetical protein